MNTKKKLSLGILAHVDAGKTTLSEAMLYTAGAIRRLGRVDHRDAFLDTDALERQRGITIFSKQAVLSVGDTEITLLDTPGHVDFSAEAERVLQVLDCAVLVVSGTDGVQSHTQTLWELLARHGVPTFLFVNKMDLPGTDREALLAALRERLDAACVDFCVPFPAVCEEAATGSKEALAEYLASGTLRAETLVGLIAQRKLFPCWFGSALKLAGVEDFLHGLVRFAPRPVYPAEFGAKVYKIGRDANDTRLTYMKITGGALKVKDLLTGESADGGAWSEKAEQIRIYSGEKFRAAEAAEAGTVCAVTGLSHTFAGQGLGTEQASQPPALEPVLHYKLLLPPGLDPHQALEKLRSLSEEDPQLHILWNERLQEIRIQLMGQVQLEVLQRIIAQRFGWAVDFGPGGIAYKETIAAPVQGVGHYEPLRHYAEVRLLLEPGKPGSGLEFASALSEDVLERSWQRLILTRLQEKQHLGVLTGSPITDMKITLIAGRAHLKHTEGGDFRQATYRAVRQGLMQAESVLLEPWYDFRLELPVENLGRALADIDRMGGTADPPGTMGELSLLTGKAPVSEMREYFSEVTAYTRGRGRLTCTLGGYFPCHNTHAVVEAAAYDPQADLENSPDSVFCAHGAGFSVPWDEVPRYAHTEDPLAKKREDFAAAPAPARSGPLIRSGSLAEDKELEAIFQRTYGKAKPRDFHPLPKASAQSGPAPHKARPPLAGPEYLLVDGYNIIFAWEELEAVAREDLETARLLLMDLLANYQGFHKSPVILVFDAYRVKGNPGSQEKYKGIHVVYTKEAQTADAYIERATYEIAKNHRVRVATSDNLEQMIILGHGAQRVSAREFHDEVERTEGRISEILWQNNRRVRPNRPLKKELEKLTADRRPETDGIDHKTQN